MSENIKDKNGNRDIAYEVNLNIGFNILLKMADNTLFAVCFLLQVPKYYEDKYSHVRNKERRIFSGKFSSVCQFIN